MKTIKSFQKMLEKLQNEDLEKRLLILFDAFDIVDFNIRGDTIRLYFNDVYNLDSFMKHSVYVDSVYYQEGYSLELILRADI